MKKRNGFISMSVVYSFFLVFATITTLLLANYAHNRLLIRELNEDIKNELSNAGNNQLARFTNLITNGDVETDDMWAFSNSSYISYSTKNFKSGARSIEFAIPASSSTMTSYQNLSEEIVPGHTYYFRCAVFSPWIVSGTSSTIRLRNLSNNNVYVFTGATTFGDNNLWTATSSVITIPENVATSTNWRLEIVEVGKVGSPVYLDDFILIDLTSAVSDDIPTKEWLDENIPYFNGVGIFNRTYNYNDTTE